MAYRDYQGELELLERRRAISEALLAQSMRPMGGTEMVGSGNVQQAVVRSPFEALAKGLQPIAGALGVKRLEDKTKGVQGERRGAMAEALESYRTAVDGGADPRTAATSMLTGIMDPVKMAEIVAADAFRPKKYLAPVETSTGALVQPSAEGGAPMPTGFSAPPPPMTSVEVGVEGDPELRQRGMVNPRDPSSFNPLGSPYKGSRGVNVNVANQMPPQEREYDKLMGKTLAGEFVDLQHAEVSATQRLQNLQQIDRLLEDVYTGTGGNQILAAQKLAQAFGLPSENISGKEAALAIGREAALQLRNPAGGAGMPGAMSDKDRVFLESMVPNLEMTAGGRKMLVEIQRKLAQRSRDVAKLARDYAQQHGGRIDTGFYNELAETYGNVDMFSGNPLFDMPTKEDVDAEIERRMGTLHRSTP